MKGYTITFCTDGGEDHLLTDHLGSTAVTAYANGGFETETRHYSWGEVRWSSGTTPTDYRFTGQMEVGYINLYWYGSRWYDDSLGDIHPTRYGHTTTARLAGVG